MSGKIERLAKLKNNRGKINALAIDQRGSLKKMLTKAMGRDAADSDVVTFKNVVVQKLTPIASGVLLDPEYGLPAIEQKADNCGVLLAYEKSGYDVQTKGRLPDLLPDWTVAKLRDAGADAIKLLVYYDPFDSMEVNKIKHDFVREVGKECAVEEMPFFFEVVSYSDSIGDEKGLVFAKEKPRLVQAYMEEFSKSEYGVDVLKVEIPVNMKFVLNTNGENNLIGASKEEFAYTYDEVMQIMREAAVWTKLPFIYLSAGVTFEMFEKSLHMINQAEVKFDGVLCGRATWQEGVEAYGRGGVEDLEKWLDMDGMNRVQTLDGLL